MKRSTYAAVAIVSCVLAVSFYLFKSTSLEAPRIVNSPVGETKVADKDGPNPRVAAPLERQRADARPMATTQRGAVDFLGNPVDLNGKTVGKYVAELSSSAQAGDIDSKFKIYRALTICARTAEQQGTLNSLPVGTTDANFISSLRLSVEFAKSVCTDVTQIQISKDRLENVRQAADAGMVEAQLAFFFEGPNGQMHDFSVPEDDQNISDWKRVAIGYLVKAGNSGNQLALSALSKAYEDGEVVPKDLKIALTYAVADSNRRSLEPGSQTTVNSLARQLTPDEVRAAIAAGNAIVAPSRN